MAVVDRTIDGSIGDLFGALVDPETYPHWLVGARDIRRIDAGWPAVGTAFHHRVGLIGPLKIADSSKVLEIDVPHVLSLEVRARPFGRGRARFELSELPGNPAARTLVRLDETPIGLLGAATLLLDPLIARRNRRSLGQLADYVVHGVSHRAPG